MEWFFFIWSAAYFIFLFFIYKGWNMVVEATAVEEKILPLITIIIVVRNEELTIDTLLSDLQNQEYPSELFEILVFDDHSEDGTPELLKNWEGKLRNLSVFDIKADDRFASPKKRAITQAMQHSKGELILTTDGDCLVGSKWLRSMANYYIDRGSNFIAGPVKLFGDDSVWNRWQILEFSSLMATTGGSINLGVPFFCNAANMGFRKKIFEEIGGYTDAQNITSGDDVFLMQKVHKKAGGVDFLKDQHAIVSTKTLTNWTDFYHQRIRWAGKWSHFTTWQARMLPVFIFVYYLTLLVSATLVAFDKFNALLFLFLLLVKLGSEWALLKKTAFFFREKLNVGIFIFSSMLYGFYAVFFGIFANMANFQWKGRTYNK